MADRANRFAVTDRGRGWRGRGSRGGYQQPIRGHGVPRTFDAHDKFQSNQFRDARQDERFRDERDRLKDGSGSDSMNHQTLDHEKSRSRDGSESRKASIDMFADDKNSQARSLTESPAVDKMNENASVRSNRSISPNTGLRVTVGNDQYNSQEERKEHVPSQTDRPDDRRPDYRPDDRPDERRPDYRPDERRPDHRPDERRPDYRGDVPGGAPVERRFDPETEQFIEVPIEKRGDRYEERPRENRHRYEDRAKYDSRPPDFGDRPGYGDRPGHGEYPGYGDRPRYEDRPRREDDRSRRDNRSRRDMKYEDKMRHEQKYPRERPGYPPHDPRYPDPRYPDYNRPPEYHRHESDPRKEYPPRHEDKRSYNGDRHPRDRPKNSDYESSRRRSRDRGRHGERSRERSYERRRRSRSSHRRRRRSRSRGQDSRSSSSSSSDSRSKSRSPFRVPSPFNKRTHPLDSLLMAGTEPVPDTPEVPQPKSAEIENSIQEQSKETISSRLLAIGKILHPDPVQQEEKKVVEVKEEKKESKKEDVSSILPGLGGFLDVDDEDLFLYGDDSGAPKKKKSPEPPKTGLAAISGYGHESPGRQSLSDISSDDEKDVLNESEPNPESVKEDINSEEVDPTLQDPTIQSILQSIGFNFELSKKMQAQAKGDEISPDNMGPIEIKTKKTEPKKALASNVPESYEERARRYREEQMKKERSPTPPPQRKSKTTGFEHLLPPTQTQAIDETKKEPAPHPQAQPPATAAYDYNQYGAQGYNQYGAQGQYGGYDAYGNYTYYQQPYPGYVAPPASADFQTSGGSGNVKVLAGPESQPVPGAHQAYPGPSQPPPPVAPQYSQQPPYSVPPPTSYGYTQPPSQPYDSRYAQSSMPPQQRRSVSPGGRRYSRSPQRRSPPRKRYSRSPSGKRFSRSPSGKRISRSPSARKRSRSPSGRRYSRSPSGRRSSRTSPGRGRQRSKRGRSYSRSPSEGSSQKERKKKRDLRESLDRKREERSRWEESPKRTRWEKEDSPKRKIILKEAIKEEKPPGPPKMTNVEKDMLLRELKDMSRDLKKLEEELDRLKRQQNEIMRKRQREKDGHRDPILLENTKLQEMIVQKLESIKRDAGQKARRYKDGVMEDDGPKSADKKFSEEKPAKRKFTEERAPDRSKVDDRKRQRKRPSSSSSSSLTSSSSSRSRSRDARSSKKKINDRTPRRDSKGTSILKSPKSEDKRTVTTQKSSEAKRSVKSSIQQTAPKSKMSVKLRIDVRYEYFDQGDYWCKHCNAFLPDLDRLYQHYLDTKHYQKMDPYDRRPWLRDVDSKKNKKASRGKLVRVPIKGTEFLTAAPTAFYCSLCKVFSGDKTCTDDHLRSQEHNEKYKRYCEDHPLYEKARETHRATGEVTAKKEERKAKDEKQDRKPDKDRKDSKVEKDSRYEDPKWRKPDKNKPKSTRYIPGQKSPESEKKDPSSSKMDSPRTSSSKSGKTLMTLKRRESGNKVTSEYTKEEKDANEGENKGEDAKDAPGVKDIPVPDVGKSEKEENSSSKKSVSLMIGKARGSISSRYGFKGKEKDDDKTKDDGERQTKTDENKKGKALGPRGPHKLPKPSEIDYELMFNAPCPEEETKKIKYVEPGLHLKKEVHAAKQKINEELANIEIQRVKTLISMQMENITPPVGVVENPQLVSLPTTGDDKEVVGMDISPERNEGNLEATPPLITASSESPPPGLPSDIPLPPPDVSVAPPKPSVEISSSTEVSTLGSIPLPTPGNIPLPTSGNIPLPASDIPMPPNKTNENEPSQQQPDDTNVADSATSDKTEVHDKETLDELRMLGIEPSGVTVSSSQAPPPMLAPNNPNLEKNSNMAATSASGLYNVFYTYGCSKEIKQSIDVNSRPEMPTSTLNTSPLPPPKATTSVPSTSDFGLVTKSEALAIPTVTAGPTIPMPTINAAPTPVKMPEPSSSNIASSPMKLPEPSSSNEVSTGPTPIRSYRTLNLAPKDDELGNAESSDNVMPLDSDASGVPTVTAGPTVPMPSTNEATTPVKLPEPSSSNMASSPVKLPEPSSSNEVSAGSSPLRSERSLDLHTRDEELGNAESSENVIPLPPSNDNTDISQSSETQQIENLNSTLDEDPGNAQSSENVISQVLGNDNKDISQSSESQPIENLSTTKDEDPGNAQSSENIIPRPQGNDNKDISQSSESQSTEKQSTSKDDDQGNAQSSDYVIPLALGNENKDISQSTEKQSTSKDDDQGNAQSSDYVTPLALGNDNRDISQSTEKQSTSKDDEQGNAQSSDYVIPLSLGNDNKDISQSTENQSLNVENRANEAENQSTNEAVASVTEPEEATPEVQKSNDGVASELAQEPEPSISPSKRGGRGGGRRKRGRGAASTPPVRRSTRNRGRGDDPSDPVSSSANEGDTQNKPECGAVNNDDAVASSSEEVNTVKSGGENELVQSSSESVQNTDNIQSSSESVQNTDNIQSSSESVQNMDNIQSSSESVRSVDNTQASSSADASLPGADSSENAAPKPTVNVDSSNNANSASSADSSACATATVSVSNVSMENSTSGGGKVDSSSNSDNVSSNVDSSAGEEKVPVSEGQAPPSGVTSTTVESNQGESLISGTDSAGIPVVSDIVQELLDDQAMDMPLGGELFGESSEAEGAIIDFGDFEILDECDAD